MHKQKPHPKTMQHFLKQIKPNPTPDLHLPNHSVVSPEFFPCRAKANRGSELVLSELFWIGVTRMNIHRRAPARASAVSRSVIVRASGFRSNQKPRPCSQPWSSPLLSLLAKALGEYLISREDNARRVLRQLPNLQVSPFLFIHTYFRLSQDP